MLFDKMLGIAERHLDFLIPTMKQAKLFLFPERPDKILPKELQENMVNLIKEDFRLPFPVVAIEDPANCIFLIDRYKGQSGLTEEPRAFIEINSSDTDISNYDPNIV